MTSVDIFSWLFWSVFMLAATVIRVWHFTNLVFDVGLSKNWGASTSSMLVIFLIQILLCYIITGIPPGSPIIALQNTDEISIPLSVTRDSGGARDPSNSTSKTDISEWLSVIKMLPGSNYSGLSKCLVFDDKVVKILLHLNSSPENSYTHQLSDGLFGKFLLSFDFLVIFPFLKRGRLSFQVACFSNVKHVKKILKGSVMLWVNTHAESKSHLFGLI